jgi:tetratricopeptide (TPR) repeat protein
MAMLSLIHRRKLRVHFRTLTLIVLFIVSKYFLYAQEPAAIVQRRISDEVRQIKEATEQHGSPERLGYLWARLASDYRKVGNFNASESAYFQAIGVFEGAPSSRNYATTLDNFGMLYLSYGKLEEAERYNKKAEEVRRSMNYTLDLARSEQHMSQIDLAKHKFKEAENESAHALTVFEEEKDSEMIDFISALNALVYTRCMRKKCEQGMEAAQRSLEISRSSFGAESLQSAHSMMAVGFALWKLGRLDDADRTMLAAVQIMRSHPSHDERSLLLALAEYRDYLRGVHRDNDAENLTRELVETRNQTTFCTTCVTVNSLRDTRR